MDNLKREQKLHYSVIDDNFSEDSGIDLGGGGTGSTSSFDVLENYYLEKDKYLENTCGSRNVQRANLRTGKLYVNQFVHGVSGNRLPFNLTLTYNPKFKNKTEIFGSQDLTNTAGKLPFKGWKFNYQQYVRKQNDKFYYYDADFMLHVFVKCQNSTNVYYDSTGQTGMLLTETLDENGLRIALEITDGKNTKLQFNLLGNLAKIIETKGTTASEVSIAYDTSNRISRVTDGAGRVFTLTYDLEKVTLTRTDLEQTQTIAELYFGVSDSSQLARIKDCKSLQNIEFDYSTNWGLYGITNGVEQESVEMTYVNSPKVYQISNYKGVGESRQLRQNVCIVEYENNESKKMVQSVVYTENNVQLTQRTYYYFAQNGEVIYSLIEDSSLSETEKTLADKAIEFFNKNTFTSLKDFNYYEMVLSSLPAYQFKFTNQDSTFVTNSGGVVSGEINVPKLRNLDTLCLFSADVTFVSELAQNVEAPVNIFLKEGDNVISTLTFTKGEKDKKISLFALSPVTHNLKISVINQSGWSISVSNANLYFIGSDYAQEVFNVDTGAELMINSSNSVSGSINWYKKANCSIISNGESYSGVEFTYNDYLLTKLSYLKNSSSFNVWYNDRKNVIANCNPSSLKFLFNSNIQKLFTELLLGKAQKTNTGYNLSYVSLNGSNLIINERSLINDSTKIFTRTLDSYFRPVRQQDENDIITAYSYDAYGNCTQKKVYPSSDTSEYITQNYTYTNGDQLASEKDYRELSTFTTAYSYDADGKLIKVTTPKGQVINYTHEEGAKDYTIMQTSLNGENLGNRVLSEKNGLPIWVDSYNADINFAYDKFDNIKMVFNNKASFYNVNTVYQNVDGAGYTEIIYGTTDKKERRYFDKYRHVYKISVLNGENWEDIIYFIYSDEPVSDDVTNPSDSSLKPSANSKLRKVVDKTSLNVYNITYDYDALGRLSETTDQGTTSVVTYDNQNRPIHIHTGISANNSFVNNNRTLQYSSDFDDTLKSEETDIYNKKLTTLYQKDSLNRPTSTTVKDGGNNGYKVSFEYYPKQREELKIIERPSMPGEILPPIYKTVTVSDGTTGYTQTVKTTDIANNVEGAYKKETITYDANGNITNIEAKLYNADEILQRTSNNSYVYDNLNRLIRENNADLNRTIFYEYDAQGNIKVAHEFSYTTAATPNINDSTAFSRSISYTLDNCDRISRITEGGTIYAYEQYDAMGNPTLHKGKNLTWERNRLVKASDDNSYYDICYDAHGQIKDILGVGYGRTLRHASGQIVYENTQLCEMFYVYNQQGVAGFYWRNNMSLDLDDGFYTFRKNIFGDVTEIYQGSNCVAKYKYDAWGNCTVYDQNDEVNTSIDFIGNVNPFRYRGYYWCEALQMYHLQTRWYDPTIGRFISPDSYEYLDPETIGGLNLYTYCLNNPIMYTDPTGYAPTAWWEWGLAGVFVAGLVVGSIFTGGLIGGAFLGAAIGAGISLGSQAIQGDLNWAQFALDIGVGAITGMVGVSSASRYLAMGIGTVVGGGSNFASQLISGKSIDEINWWKVGVSAIIGGMASFFGGAGAQNFKAVNSAHKVSKAINSVNKVVSRMNTGYYSSSRYAQAAFTNVFNRLGKAVAKQQLMMIVSSMAWYGGSTIATNILMGVW